jgi:hypothetical protein
MCRRAVAAVWASLALVLGSEGCGGPTESTPILVKRVSLTPPSAAVLIGDRVSLTADIVTDQPFTPAIIWSVAQYPAGYRPSGPIGTLTVAVDRRSAEWIAPAAGQYQITVTAGGLQARSLATVSWLPADSPLLGTWKLRSWQLAPTGGGAPETVAFGSGWLWVDSQRLSLYVLAPDEYLYDDGTPELDYVGGPVEGQKLTLCPVPGVTPCLGATWTLTDSVLTLVGPEKTYDLLDDRLVTGVPTFEFVR